MNPFEYSIFDEEQEDDGFPSSFLPLPEPHFVGNSTNHNKSNQQNSVRAVDGGRTANNADVAILLEMPEELRRVLPENPNAMQRDCLNVMLRSDQNIVLSAPTGAGKTCILDMALIRFFFLKQLENHQGNNNNGNSFTQALYICPSRALCSLQAQGFRNRFEHLGLKVDVRIGGDDESSGGGVGNNNKPATVTKITSGNKPLQRESASNNNGHAATSGGAHLVVTTPEKLEADTRNSLNLAKYIGLILVDEIHFLGDPERGAVLESVITRLRSNSFQSSQPRFVCISATIPNSSELGDWLNASTRVYHDRPCPLTTYILGFDRKNKSEFIFEKELDRQIPSVLRKYAGNRPSLVFVNSRKGAKDLAEALCKFQNWSSQPAQLNTALTNAQIHTPGLLACLKKGCAWHSAELDANDRHHVEELFSRTLLGVIVCTSTLAVGVDLPAYCVVLKSVRAYRGLGGFQDVDRATLIQMVGRAGRPSYDTHGVAVILVEQGSESRFEDLTNGLARVDSQFLKNRDLSMEAMNAEIVQCRIRNEDGCKKWWENSFAGYQETVKQQQVVSEGGGGETSSYYKVCLQELIKLKCVVDNAVSLQSTVTGKIACTYRLKINTVSLFADFILHQESGAASSGESIVTASVNEQLRTILAKVCFAKEFESLIVRRDQKTQLNNIAWTLGRFKFSKSNYRVKTFSDKTFQLVQGVLSNVAFADTLLRQEVHFVMERIPRMTRALLKMMIDSKNVAAICCAVLVRSLQTKSWEDNIFNQLDGVGAKTLERLKELNVLNSLDQIIAKPAHTSGLLAPKSIAHVKSIVAQRKTCSVVMDGNKTIIAKLTDVVLKPGVNNRNNNNRRVENEEEEEVDEPPPSKTRGSNKKEEQGYWLAVVTRSSLIGWSDSGCLAIPSGEVKHFEVWGIHKKWIGIDFRLNYSIGAGGALKLINQFNENYEVWKTSPFSYLPSSNLFNPNRMEQVNSASLFVSGASIAVAAGAADKIHHHNAAMMKKVDAIVEKKHDKGKKEEEEEVKQQPPTTSVHFPSNNNVNKTMTLGQAKKQKIASSVNNPLNNPNVWVMKEKKNPPASSSSSYPVATAAAAAAAAVMVGENMTNPRVRSSNLSSHHYYNNSNDGVVGTVVRDSNHNRPPPVFYTENRARENKFNQYAYVVGDEPLEETRRTPHQAHYVDTSASSIPPLFDNHFIPAYNNPKKKMPPPKRKFEDVFGL